MTVERATVTERLIFQTASKRNYRRFRHRIMVKIANAIWLANVTTEIPGFEFNARPRISWAGPHVQTTKCLACEKMRYKHDRAVWNTVALESFLRQDSRTREEHRQCYDTEDPTIEIVYRNRLSAIQCFEKSRQKEWTQ